MSEGMAGIVGFIAGMFVMAVVAVLAVTSKPGYRLYVDDGDAATQHICGGIVERRGSIYCLHQRQEAQEKFDTASVVWVDSTARTPTPESSQQ